MESGQPPVPATPSLCSVSADQRGRLRLSEVGTLDCALWGARFRHTDSVDPEGSRVPWAAVPSSGHPPAIPAAPHQALLLGGHLQWIAGRAQGPSQMSPVLQSDASTENTKQEAPAPNTGAPCFPEASLPPLLTGHEAPKARMCLGVSDSHKEHHRGWRPPRTSLTCCSSQAGAASRGQAWAGEGWPRSPEQGGASRPTVWKP